MTEGPLQELLKLPQGTPFYPQPILISCPPLWQNSPPSAASLALKTFQYFLLSAKTAQHSPNQKRPKFFCLLPLPAHLGKNPTESKYSTKPPTTPRALFPAFLKLFQRLLQFRLSLLFKLSRLSNFLLQLSVISMHEIIEFPLETTNLCDRNCIQQT